MNFVISSGSCGCPFRHREFPMVSEFLRFDVLALLQNLPRFSSRLKLLGVIVTPSADAAFLVQVAPAQGCHSLRRLAFLWLLARGLMWLKLPSSCRPVFCWFAFMFVHVLHLCPSVFTVSGVRVDVCVSPMFYVFSVCALCSWLCVFTHHTTNVNH